MGILATHRLHRLAVQAGSTEAGSDVDRPAGIGEAVETDDWRVTALEVLWGQDVYDRYDPDDRRTTRLGDADPASIPLWLALRVVVMNLRDAEAYLSATAFMLADADGVASVRFLPFRDDPEARYIDPD